MSATAEQYATGIGPDYDAFDLTTSITAAYDGETTSVFPLFYEGLGPSAFPPNGFFVVAPANYRLSLDWLNFLNSTSGAVTVSLQLYRYSGNPSSPYGTAGAVVFTETLAAGASLPVDGTRFRISVPEGFFLVAFATGSGIGSTTPVGVQARARFTPG